MAEISDKRGGYLGAFDRRAWAGVALGVAILLAFAASPSAHAAGPESAFDARQWELVSPVEKNGGEVESPGGPGAGVLQAAAGGNAIAYASDASFGAAEGAAPVSQYLATRGVGGWSSANLTPPQLSGTYEGGAYQLFSSDLSRAILSSGWRCRDGGAECAAENPPLAAGAPADYRNLYLRDSASATYTPLITTANSPALALAPEDFQLALVSASPDLSHVVISTCAALTVGSSEVPGSEGCDPGSPNYYEWSAGALAEVEPDDWEAEFDPGAEVQGVLGASADRSRVYYVNSSGLWLWHAGTNTKVAAGADPSNYPAATGTARVTPDGGRLAFLSSASLTGYPNGDKAEVFLYEAPTGKLICASCNPKGTAPRGPSSIPGARAAGDGPPLYKPRALADDGTRLFFDSADALLSVDTDKAPDVYQWVANGTAGCTKAVGCIGLVSGGRVGSSTFADASADGTDAFFLTAASLLPADPGSVDLYDARAGGGFPEPPPPIPCIGDACQGPPPGPDDPAPATGIFTGHGNPPLPSGKRPPCKKNQRRKGKRCVRKHGPGKVHRRDRSDDRHRNGRGARG